MTVLTITASNLLRKTAPAPIVWPPTLVPTALGRFHGLRHHFEKPDAEFSAASSRPQLAPGWCQQAPVIAEGFHELDVTAGTGIGDFDKPTTTLDRCGQCRNIVQTL